MKIHQIIQENVTQRPLQSLRLDSPELGVDNQELNIWPPDYVLDSILVDNFEDAKAMYDHYQTGYIRHLDFHSKITNNWLEVIFKKFHISPTPDWDSSVYARKSNYTGSLLLVYSGKGARIVISNVLDLEQGVILSRAWAQFTSKEYYEEGTGLYINGRKK